MANNKRKKIVKKKSPKKRTHKEAFGNSQEESQKFIKKHKIKANSKVEQILNLLELGKDKSNLKKDNNNKKEDINQIENNNETKDSHAPTIFSEANINSFCSISNGEFYINTDNLKKVIYYEQIFFNEIEIIGDGNCLFRSISYHLFGTQNNYEEIRLSVYNYIKNNPTFVYEYCYEENNLFYIDVDTKIGNETKKIKYFIEDYIECIQKDGFFAGFIELYMLSKIYDIPILILIKNSDGGLLTYKKIMDYNNSEKFENKLVDIIYLLFVNDDHYLYLEQNIKYIENISKKINITNNLGGNLDKEKNLKITDINSISNNKKDTKIIEQQNYNFHDNEKYNVNKNNKKKDVNLELITSNDNQNIKKSNRIKEGITGKKTDEITENMINLNYLDKFVTYSNNLNTDSKSIDIEITGNNTINNQNINEIKDNQHKKGNNNEIIFFQ